MGNHPTRPFLPRYHEEAHRNLNDLSVNSFEIESPAAPCGTVEGMEGESQYCGTTLFEYLWYTTWLQPDEPVQG